jgi:hypothetical protein
MTDLTNGTIIFFWLISAITVVIVSAVILFVWELINPVLRRRK